MDEHVVVPNVLADGDADFFAVNLHRLDAFGRLKVAVLVEHIVRGWSW